MPNMTMTKLPMPEQDPKVRARNFEEVSYGYTEEMAVEEAQRCLHCKHMPCVSGCPVNVQIPKFIQLIAEHKFADACAAIKETSALPAVCGRVCPQETQCEAKCVRGIKGEPVAIGRLERFAADWDMKNGKNEVVKPESNGHKVAVIGAGPAGLTCAGDLAKKGYEVTIFEAFHKAGGVLVYGIPEFRLPKAIVQKEVEGLEKMGVKVMTDMVIGKVLSIDELMDDMGFEAVFIGSGAGLPMFMGIEGEDLVGVSSANEYPDQNQPDESIPRRLRHPDQKGQERRSSRRRQRCNGRCQKRDETGRRACLHHLPPFRGGAAGPPRGGSPRQGRGHRVCPAD